MTAGKYSLESRNRTLLFNDTIKHVQWKRRFPKQFELSIFPSDIKIIKKQTLIHLWLEDTHISLSIQKTLKKLEFSNFNSDWEYSFYGLFVVLNHGRRKVFYFEEAHLKKDTQCKSNVSRSPNWESFLKELQNFLLRHYTFTFGVTSSDLHSQKGKSIFKLESCMR